MDEFVAARIECRHAFSADEFSFVSEVLEALTKHLPMPAEREFKSELRWKQNGTKSTKRTAKYEYGTVQYIYVYTE